MCTPDRSSSVRRSAACFANMFAAYYGYGYLNHYDYDWEEGVEEKIMGVAPARKFILCKSATANCTHPPVDDDVDLPGEWAYM